MHAAHLAVRVVKVTAGPLLAVALLGIAPAAASASASASECLAWTGTQPPSPGVVNELNGVAALSSCRAWAVGDYQPAGPGPPQTLIERWNGHTWTRQTSPDPGGSASYNALNGVAVVSSRDAWAVGSYTNGTVQQTLIEHWDGTKWRHVPSPDPSATQSVLSGVAALSSRNIWADGFYYNGTFNQTLIEHWNGRAWKQAKSPDPAGSDVLQGVAATSARNAWAVGDNGEDHTLILRWNGRTWRRMRSPNPGGSSILRGVAATSARNAWAVGKGGTGTTLILHWNGRAWRHVPSPPLTSSSTSLNGVAATSATNAWAVGSYFSIPASAEQTLLLHWDGRSWRRAQSPDPSDNFNLLNAVAASSARNIWAAGAYDTAVQEALALHCC